MKWNNFVDHIKSLGFDGDTDNFDEVVLWLKDNGHNPFTVKAGTETINLKQLWESRPGQTLDVTPAAIAATKQEEIRREVQATIDELESVHGPIGGSRGEKANPHYHDVRMIKDRIEDDPCLGYRKAADCGFGQWLHDLRCHVVCTREGRVEQSPVRFQKAYRIQAKQAGMNEALDSEGGALVVTEHANFILKHMWETGQVFPRARVVNMTSKDMDIPWIVETSRVDGSRQGGVRAFLTDEAAAVTATQPALGTQKLVAHKLMAVGHVTSELEEDSQQTIGALQLLGELFAEEMSFKYDDLFINGTGAGQPMGIQNAPALVSTTRTTATNIRGDDIGLMWARFPGRSQANAVWFANQDTMSDLIRLAVLPPAGGAGDMVPIWTFPGSAGSTFAMILGRPVVFIEQAQTLGTAGDLILADMTQYMHGLRRGLTTAQSIHVNFLTDQIAYRATLRMDGQPGWDSAVTPFNGANTISPFIRIAT